MKRISILCLFILMFLNYSIHSFTQVSQQWTSRYSFSGNSMDGGSKVVLDNSNNIYVSGPSFGSGTDYDYVTIKYSSTGKEVWVRRYTGNGPDIPSDMIIDNAGNIYVTGRSDYSPERKDFVTIKYNPEGVQMWVSRYTCIGYETFPTSMETDNLNNIYITGKNDNYFTTLKYDSNGNIVWISDYPAPFSRDVPWDIVVDNYYNVYVTGGCNSDAITIKYNAIGIQEWVSIYAGKVLDQDFNNSIGIDSSNNIYVSGSSVEIPGTYGGYLTIKYNSSGIQQWVRFYSGTANFFHISKAMNVDKFGNVYVTGYSTESGQGYNFTTIKYNTNGDTLWKASYHNGSNDIASDIKIDNLGNVYVTGRSDGNGTGDDFVTIKYDKFGIQQWIKSYDYSGTYGDFGRSIAIDKNYNVLVTGNSNRDIFTIKYSQLTGTSTIFSEIPTHYSLSQNYPNPFNPKTVISYEFRVSNDAELKVFDVLGNEVAELVNEKQNAGSYSVEFDGSGFASGIFFYSLITNGVIIDTKRMILLK